MPRENQQEMVHSALVEAYLTVEELAKQLNLGVSTVRRHLRALQKEGRVLEATVAWHGVGRPRKVYVANHRLEMVS